MENKIAKNDEITVTIIDLSHEGMGVAKVDGYPLFIENALPGEEVRIRVLKTLSKFGFAKVTEFITKSPERVEDANLDLIRTGIAPLAHLNYPAQLEFKRAQVVKQMRNFDVEVEPVIGAARTHGYRNKAQVPVRRVNDHLATGFFRKNTHTLVPMESFYLQEPEIDEAVIAVRDILDRFGVEAYNEQDHTGNLRHIIVRRSDSTGEMMVTLVIRKKKIFQLDKIADIIVGAVPKIVSIVVNINPDKTNAILGDEEQVVYGTDHLEDQLLGKSYLISSRSFYQVNSEQTAVLYQKAIELAGITKDDNVVDAYSGIGTIALSIADSAKSVTGIEIVESAVEDARRNAKLNGVSNAEFLLGDAGELIGATDYDVLIVDPARKGLSEKFIFASLKAAPKRIVYISCNPATQARDLKLYVEGGYMIQRIVPVDMFPQTSHVECVVLMSRI
ncbi:MAG: 23S rRNA (uracil(1939)-C(5))-methyltransferase RlmD [Lactobacillales bacterium]|jgi:23S rRNA (uracil1939-C5)-methyltransferase|nr:23S rRNA (uracil(1939)-C(5))-methyltransferase RlmD [Lactobacillales bacterium]